MIDPSAYGVPATYPYGALRRTWTAPVPPTLVQYDGRLLVWHNDRWYEGALRNGVMEWWEPGMQERPAMVEWDYGGAEPVAGDREVDPGARPDAIKAYQALVATNPPAEDAIEQRRRGWLAELLREWST